MKKIVSLLVCLVLGCTALAGCSNKEIDDSETNLIISLYDGGYGTSAFHKLADKFEEHYAEEGYTVTFIDDPALVSSTAISKISAGPKVTPTDLFLPGDVQFRQIISQGDKFIKGYKYGLEDLTDLFGQKVYGENLTYGEKLDPQYADGSAIEIDGETRYFSVPFLGGISGLAYNNELFKETTAADVLEMVGALPEEIAALRKSSSHVMLFQKNIKSPTKTGKNLSKSERNKNIVDMYNAGYSIDDIANVSGFSSKSSIFRILNKYNVDLNRGRTKGPRRKKGMDETE